jgi:ferric-dicitrate binding protein FerR (iron transport regulator)
MSIAQGRCAGCAESGPLKAVEWHILSCPSWAKLYQQDPDRALDPAAEFARWASEDREHEHAADLAQRVADTVASRAASRKRFATVDLLGDDDEHDRQVG